MVTLYVTGTIACQLPERSTNLWLKQRLFDSVQYPCEEYNDYQKECMFNWWIFLPGFGGSGLVEKILGGRLQKNSKYVLILITFSWQPMKSTCNEYLRFEAIVFSCYWAISSLEITPVVNPLIFDGLIAKLTAVCNNEWLLSSVLLRPAERVGFEPDNPTRYKANLKVRPTFNKASD